MSKRLGRVVGGRFVDERELEAQQRAAARAGLADDEAPNEGKGFADPEAVIAERMAEHDRQTAQVKAREQLETIDHVIEAIDVEALTWESLGYLAEINERLIRKWRDGIVVAVRGPNE